MSAGSSPLARGLPRTGPRARPGPWDHPRSRGVYAADAERRLCEHGSSPLARGLREGFKPGRNEPGIIPARAGFTRWVGACARRCRDHPRSRGVYDFLAEHGIKLEGSSPLARGLHREDPDRHHRFRIIPARAGFTPRTCRRRSPREDHPRSRGVYRGLPGPGRPAVGSSPLARGLLFNSVSSFVSTGIIPARAGFTGDEQWQRIAREDHPRSRGVYPAQVSEGELNMGSSPLARGLRE